MKRRNRYERKRHYKLLRTPLETHGHSSKEGKQHSNRVERRAINQQCHMAKLDPDREIFLDDPYNRRNWSRHSCGWHWYGQKPEHRTWGKTKRFNLQPKTRDEARHLPQWMQHRYQKNLSEQTHEERCYDLRTRYNYDWQWRRSLEQYAAVGDWENFTKTYNSYAYGDPPAYKLLGQKANTRSEAHEIALKSGTPRWFKIHSQGISEITYAEAEVTSYYYLPRYTVRGTHIFVQFKTYEEVQKERYW